VRGRQRAPLCQPAEGLAGRTRRATVASGGPRGDSCSLAGGGEGEGEGREGERGSARLACDTARYARGRGAPVGGW